MRAFVMAAGYGKRLGGLGEEIPKPLLPLGGVPLIGFALEKLARVGLREAAVNLHHGAEKIRSALGARTHGVRVQYFHEPEILGTAGGIKNAEAFLRERGEPFFVLNADAPCGADLGEALAHHQKGGFLTTLILRCSPEVEKYGALALDEVGRLRGFLGARAPGIPEGELRQAMFTGLSVMSPEMLEHIPPGVASDISTEIYPPLVESGARIGAILSDSYWADVGTLSKYLQASADILSGRFVPEFPWPPRGFALLEGPPMRWGEGNVVPPVLLGSDVLIQKDAQAGPFAVLMEGATLRDGAVVRESVIFPGGSVDGYSVLNRCVVGPGAMTSPSIRRARDAVFLRGAEQVTDDRPTDEPSFFMKE